MTKTTSGARLRLPKLDIRGRWFVAEDGRRVILRGVNLGGDSKVPYPDGGTNHPTQFDDHRTVSFIGRPFPLAEADEHLGRLAHWGFNVVRLLTTWEAVEHAGPGQYDSAYLDYLAEVCRKCGEHGLYVFIDFHQDVWSRMSGGDGAPGWIFEAVGLDFTKFHAADAAHLMQAKYDYARGGRQDGYPQMSWASNYRLPANLIMWTLFFAGRDFTPAFAIQGRNVQDYLQDHYLGAMRQVAQRVSAMPHVIGFDTLNEPGEGMIGEELDYRRGTNAAEHSSPLRFSSLDALLMARGVARELLRYARDTQDGAVKAAMTMGNANGISIWRPGVTCPFEAAGAYRLVEGRPEVLRNDHFQRVNGRDVDFEADYLQPFCHRVGQTVRGLRPDWLLFAEMNPYKAFVGQRFPPGMPERCVNASHWYDVVVLRSKEFDYPEVVDDASGLPGPGAGAVRDRYVAQLASVAGAGEKLGADGAPALIGEFGIPFDLDDSAAYRARGRSERSPAPWARHVVAQSLMYDALDRLLLSSTQWNYTASNRNEAACGDGWNQEDLSIFSRDQQELPENPDSGGRAVAGFSRPYARFISGEPVSMSFDIASASFTLTFEPDSSLDQPTEIFVPALHYPHGYIVSAPECEVQRSPDATRVWIGALSRGRKTVTINRPGS